MGILQARILEWVGMPFSRRSSQPRDQTSSPTPQVNSLPAEPPGKPKNTGMGSLFLLQGNFLTQESNWGLLHCSRFFTSRATQEALPDATCPEIFLSTHGYDIAMKIWEVVFFNIIVLKKKPTSSPIYNHILVLSLETGKWLWRSWWGNIWAKIAFCCKWGKKLWNRPWCQEWVWGEQWVGRAAYSGSRLHWRH